MKLENNIAFVTGGGRSIGRAICLKLAEEGANVVIANSSLEPANEVAKFITGQNYPVCGLMNLGLNEPLLR